MGFRKFPAPKWIGQAQPGDPCRRHGCTGVYRPWDCGCAWGCELCSASLCCSVCHDKARRPAPKKERRARASTEGGDDE